MRDAPTIYDFCYFAKRDDGRSFLMVAQGILLADGMTCDAHANIADMRDGRIEGQIDDGITDATPDSPLMMIEKYCFAVILRRLDARYILGHAGVFYTR